MPRESRIPGRKRGVVFARNRAGQRQSSSCMADPISTTAICCLNWTAFQIPTALSITTRGAVASSADGVKPEDVTLGSDIADIEKVRQYYHLDSVVLLGHSWGTVLALEYALRYPGRVSHMILMNPAPASEADYKQLRNDWLEKRASRHGAAKSDCRHRRLQRGRSRGGHRLLSHPFQASAGAIRGLRKAHYKNAGKFCPAGECGNPQG